MLVLACALGGVVIYAPRLARAGDAGAGSATGASISPLLAVPRFMPGSSAAAPAHLNDFSPAAINYTDCADQIDLQLTLDLSGAPANDEIQVWAGAGSADCTETSARTGTSNSSPTTFPGRCWPAAPPGTFAPTGSSATARLHVLDLVSYIGQPAPPITYADVQAQVLAKGKALCQPHATTGAVPLNIYFIFVPAGSGTGTGNPAVAPDGISGLYQTPAALVGPFAPTNVTVPNTGISPTSLLVTWVPQSESTIQGFNVYAIDQGPNAVNAGGLTTDASPTTQPAGLYCPATAPCPSGGDDSGGSDDSSGEDSGDDDSGSSDAGAGDATVRDAGCDAEDLGTLVPVDAAAYADASEAGLAALGCEYKNGVNSQSTVGQAGSPWCYSADLQNAFTVDGGLGSAATSASDASLTTSTLTVSDDAGVDSGVDSGTTSLDASMALASSISPTVPEVAGISIVSVSPDYVTGGTSNSYTLTGLTTGDQYAIAVAAVDSYGNVGPLGVAPAPVSGGAGIAACSTPTIVDDFWDKYKTDGGLSLGGGYCALTAPGAPAPFFATMFGAGLGAAVVARGRRRKQRRQDREAA